MQLTAVLPEGMFTAGSGGGGGRYIDLQLTAVFAADCRQEGRGIEFVAGCRQGGGGIDLQLVADRGAGVEICSWLQTGG